MIDKEQYAVARAAIEWLDSVPSDASVEALIAHCRQSLGAQWEAERILGVLPAQTAKNEALRANIFVACVLIYLFTEQYPDQIFGKDATDADNDYIRLKRAQKDYLDACRALSISPKLQIKNEDALSAMEKGVRGASVAKLLRASHFKNYSIIEFLAELVLRKDTYFAAKYTAADWRQMIAACREAQANPITPICHDSKKTSRFAIHSISVMGENHKKCDDRSGIISFDEKTWFAYCADGVGSAADSDVGSQNVAYSFASRLKFLYDKYKKSPTRLYQKLAGYLLGLVTVKKEDSFAVSSYRAWRRKIQSQVATEAPLDLSSYATTLLFTFGTEKFIVCGMVGDGNFAIEKKERLNGKELYGYFFLSDGISGVTQNNPLTVAHLEKCPTALQLKFFAPDEVSAILMATDGANALRHQSMDGILLSDSCANLNMKAVFEDLRDRDFSHTQATITDMALRYSSGNSFGGGRGDDCSIVYIKSEK